ncbi:MAG: hypothetical protein K2N72_06095 [Oscillospiraceae bacterium]|nr:hypothetical protein [Oscillospiraceae bacterium]
MKKAECAENKSAKGKVSAWYYVDFAVSLLACVFSFLITAFLRIYFIFFAIELVCFVSVCTLIYSYKKPPETRAGRVLMRTVRVTVYTAALAGAFLLFMPSDIPVLYPVDKAVFVFNYTDTDMFYFLPDKLPSNARNYYGRFVPGFGQGSAGIRIEFFTDTAQLEEYRSFAQSCGAVKTENKGGWEQGYINEKTGREEAVEIWEFPKPEGGGYRANYYICPESGYFMIVW